MELIGISFCLLGKSEGAFLLQYTRSWSDISNLNKMHWLTFWEELVNTWSMRVATLVSSTLAVLLATLVSSLTSYFSIEISCSKEKEKEKSR